MCTTNPCTAGSSTYLFYTDANDKTWATAETECVKWGGHLIAINSETEKDTITGLL